MNFSIIVVIAYLWLLLISTSPFGLNLMFLAFLSVLALFPFPAFVWTAWQTSAISEKIQAKSIEIVNQQVARLYAKGDTASFEKWMEIQDRTPHDSLPDGHFCRADDHSANDCQYSGNPEGLHLRQQDASQNQKSPIFCEMRDFVILHH